MVVVVGVNDYSVRSFHAYSRRLRLAAYYEIRRSTVRELRVRQRMTQDRLAKEAGVSKQTITRMETGPNIPQFDTIEKVAKALKTDADNLIIYYTPENERRIDEAQKDWERRIEEDDGTGNRGA